jgi:lipopolysaccharide/colanic/teichoic acid biosynthesis glycosyltransferase
MSEISPADATIIASPSTLSRRFDSSAGTLRPSPTGFGPTTATGGSLELQGLLDTLEPAKYHDLKRYWEVPVALVLAVPALLMTALLILLVRATSKGPGIYPQVRTGKNGRSFRMFKLRSMYQDAEARGAQWSTGDHDPRVTPVGRWLRKLHLDELPQIVNVLRGEMSFCGPRPERPEFIEKLVRTVPYYSSRLAVRPGITGFSQINLPPDSDLGSVMKKQTLDLEYVENASLFADLKMVACTALRLIGIPGSVATKIAGLSMSPDESRFSVIYAPLWEKNHHAKDAAQHALTPDLVCMDD